MRTLKSFAAAFVLGVLASVALVGCGKKPTFHVQFSDSCAAVPIVGTMGGIVYALIKPPGKDFIACYGLPTAAVGKDVPAALDLGKGEMALTLDGARRIFIVQAAREQK